jgi:hypothetical protein
MERAQVGRDPGVVFFHLENFREVSRFLRAFAYRDHATGDSFEKKAKKQLKGASYGSLQASLSSARSVVEIRVFVYRDVLADLCAGGLVVMAGCADIKPAQEFARTWFSTAEGQIKEWGFKEWNN